MSEKVKQIEQELKAEMPYRWKVQAVSKYKPSATCVAYIDARDAMDRLDEVVGIANWQDSYSLIGNVLYCTISIRIGDEWIQKSDCGIESNMEKEKGQSSDAFKRACVKWGIGRFLYSLDVKHVPTNEKNEGNNHPYPVDGNGKRVWDLTKHINNMGNGPAPKPKPKSKELTTKEIRNLDIGKLFKKQGKKLDKEHVEVVKKLIEKTGKESIDDLTRQQFDELLEAIEFELKEE